MSKLAAVLVAVVSAVGVMLASHSGAAHRVWFKAAFVNPQWHDIRALPPFPAPEWNPFSLYESGIGATLCGLVADAADRAEHLGATDVIDVPFATAPALWLYRLNRAMEPKTHIHASEAEGGQHEHEHEMQGREREAQYAVQARNRLMEWSYMLDPTNLTALMIFKDAVSAGTADKSLIPAEEFGVKKDIPRGDFRALQLCRYSLPRFDVESGYWPEQCLYAGKAIQFAWLAFDGNHDAYAKQDALERAARLKRMRMVRDDIRGLLARADAQRTQLIKRGYWKLRTEAAKERYNVLLAGLGAVARMMETRLADEDGESQTR